jgi:ankyrin repeat protein
MLTRDNGVSCLCVIAQVGHLDVVKALLGVGRELVMIMHNGKSCLLISASKGHQEVLKALLEVGGREL